MTFYKFVIVNKSYEKSKSKTNNEVCLARAWCILLLCDKHTCMHHMHCKNMDTTVYFESGTIIIENRNKEYSQPHSLDRNIIYPNLYFLLSLLLPQ